MKNLFIVLFFVINSFILAQNSQQQMINEIIKYPERYENHTFSLFDVKIRMPYEDWSKYNYDFTSAYILGKDAFMFEYFLYNEDINFIIPNQLHKFLKSKELIYKDELQQTNIKWLTFIFVSAPPYAISSGYNYFAIIQDIEFENGLIINHDDYPFRF
ncbi:MAG: hypothetical protein NTU73_01325 [Ignavibacteriae bacterium]|nr:hypothetical protein [Ignavibacteriota bacterium]